MASSIRVLEVTTITPFGSAANVEFILPLTFLDTFLFTVSPVEALYFYRLPDIDHEFFDTQILSNLKSSLSHALANFLPLAGNLIFPSPDAPKPTIRYAPNNGVSFTVAESEDDFNRLSGDESYEAVKFHPLIPLLNSSDETTSIMAIQVTLFPNEGFSIGTTTDHISADGKSAIMFIKAWAYISSQGKYHNNFDTPLPSEQIPFFDRTVIKDPMNLDVLYLKHRMYRRSSAISDPKRRSLKVSQNFADVDRNLVRATFRLTRENVMKMRESVLSELGEPSKILHLSSFVLTTAYTITCMVKATEGEMETIVFCAFPVDYRKRLDFPVPGNYFGNCVGIQVINERKGLIHENGLALIAKKLSDVIKRLEKGNVLDGAESKLSGMMNAKKEESLKRLLISVGGSPQLLLYELNFGWGRPEKVEIVSIDRAKTISMADSRDGNGGIEIGLALGKHEMEKFASLFKEGLDSHY